ncbi:hypothetical protein FRC08_004947 [Ceratobasidium sp. 394]|nr:hypothetical protein FRC08_004947 [Ceratobasidium sp. 394]
MAALLALGYNMLVEAQKANDAQPPTNDQPSVSTTLAPQADEAAPTWASTLNAIFTPEAGATPSQSSAAPTPPASPPLQSKPSAVHRSSTKGESGGDSTRSGSTRRQKMHASKKDLDDEYKKQMAKVAKLMRKMARAEQREKNARWKAAMKDISMARAAGIDPQSDKVGWDEDSDDEDAEHADTTLKKPVTDLSAKSTDPDVPAPESGDTLARFIHAMFTSMNPFEDAHVERDGKPVAPTAQPSDSQTKPPAPKADQGTDTEVLRLLSSASAMNQETRSRGSVWNFLDRLTPGKPKKDGPEAAAGSVMFSAPLFITENSKVEIARSEMRTVEEEHESDSEDGKPQSSKFANLVTRMGMEGMFGKKKGSEAKAGEPEAPVVEAKAEPVAPAAKEMRVWRPSPENISLQCSWWGYRIYLPPPVLAVLGDQKLEAANRAALVTTSLQWMIDHIPTALLPPQIGLVMSLIRGIIPALGYIGGFIAWSWNAISGADKGDGVVLSATWLLPIALIPGPWDIPPEPKQVEPEPEPVATVKTRRPSISRTPSFAKMIPSLERKGSTRSTASSSEKKATDKAAAETRPIPIKRPTEPAKRPSAAGPLPTPPSSFPRSATHLGSLPPLEKSKEPSQDSERPTLKKSTSKMGLNIVWSDKPQTEEPQSTETAGLKRKASFKLPMPDVTWEHERKAAEAEAAAKLKAEQDAKAAAKAKLKNKYAQALLDEMNAEKAPVGWSRFS